MGETLISTLETMGWLGIVLGILAIVNIVTGILVNTWSDKESFSWNKMFKGIGKVIIFYVSAVALSVAFTILPYINEMITNTFGTVLLSGELLNSLSSVGVFGVVVSTIVVQGKKAIQGVIALANLSSNTEEITWDVEIPQEDVEEE